MLPALEAAPAELAGGARLVPESETVFPAELPRAPGAAPGECEAVDRLALVGQKLSREIGAAGTGGQSHSLDAELGMRVEELREHSLHLHPGRMTAKLDPRGRSSLNEVEHLSLELRMSGGSFEVGEEPGHGRQSRVDHQYDYKRLQSEGLGC